MPQASLLPILKLRPQGLTGSTGFQWNRSRPPRNDAGTSPWTRWGGLHGM